MLTAKITTSVVVDQSGTSDLAAPDAPLTKSYVENYANGTGADQAQEIFSDSRTVTGSSTDNLDLSGSLSDALNIIVAFTGVKELLFKNTGTTQLRFGKKIANGFAGPFDQTAGSLGVTVEANGIFHARNASAAGWAVTAGTADLLSVENLGVGAGAYDVIIIGK